MTIIAVIVTYRRPTTLTQTLAGITSQSRPADRIVVVDNDADDAVRDLLSDRPNVDYIASPSNVGYGAALALGMRHARAVYDPAWYWLLDDDTPPAPDHVQKMLEIAHSSPHAPWVIANRGGRIQRGRIRHGFDNSNAVNLAQFTLVDGTLVSHKAVEAVGLPREDLFMMMEDIEYTTRIAAAGGTLLVQASEVNAMHLGSASSWRAFYQARNHLRIALDRRSAAYFWGWMYRMAALSLTDVRRGRWLSLRFRWWGALHGAMNRMGQDVHPRLLLAESGGQPED